MYRKVLAEIIKQPEQNTHLNTVYILRDILYPAEYTGVLPISLGWFIGVLNQNQTIISITLPRTNGAKKDTSLATDLGYSLEVLCEKITTVTCDSSECLEN